MKRSRFFILFITFFLVGRGHATNWTWDIDVQFNTDDDYETVEGTGKTTATALLNEDGSVTVTGEFVKHSGKLPKFVNAADVIATDGFNKALQKRSMSAGGFSIYQVREDIWKFEGRVYNPLLPENNGHFEVALFSNYNNKPYYFFINSNSPIDKHYLPSTGYGETIPTTATTTTTTTTTTTNIIPPTTTTTICSLGSGFNHCTTEEGFDGLCRHGKCWPTVACCRSDDLCEEISEYDCTILGLGKSQGQGSKCRPDPCVKEITKTTIETTTTIPSRETGIPWLDLITVVIFLGAITLSVIYSKIYRR